MLGTVSRRSGSLHTAVSGRMRLESTQERVLPVPPAQPPRVSFPCELSLGGQRVCEPVLTQQHVPLSPSLSAVRHDKNPGSGLLLEATSFTPGRETQGLCRGDPPLPHPVQEIHRATGSRAPPDGQEPEKVGPGKPPPPAPTSTPAWRRQPQAPAEAAFLRKTQEMYVRAILLVCLTIRPHVSRWYF